MLWVPILLFCNYFVLILFLFLSSNFNLLLTRAYCLYWQIPSYFLVKLGKSTSHKLYVRGQFRLVTWTTNVSKCRNFPFSSTQLQRLFIFLKPRIVVFLKFLYRKSTAFARERKKTPLMKSHMFIFSRALSNFGKTKCCLYLVGSPKFLQCTISFCFQYMLNFFNVANSLITFTLFLFCVLLFSCKDKNPCSSQWNVSMKVCGTKAKTILHYSKPIQPNQINFGRFNFYGRSGLVSFDI